MREAWVLLQAILIGGQDSVRARVYVQALLNKYTVSGTANLSDRHQREGSLAKLRLAGERLSFEWGRIEAVRGTRNWATMDSIIAELDALHLKYYGLLTFSPGWAVPPGLTKMPRIDSHRPVVDGSSARGDTLFAAFAGEHSECRTIAYLLEAITGSRLEASRCIDPSLLYRAAGAQEARRVSPGLSRPSHRQRL